MTRPSLFSSPMLVGFQDLEQLLDRVAKTSSDGFPPYNIEQLDDRRFMISLAVAGFGEDDLDVSIEDRQLVVRGRQADGAEHHYLHRGIAARQFQRGFVLADGLEVTGAWLDKGLLHIALARTEPENRVRSIPISGARK